MVIALDNSTCAPIRGGFGLAHASPACVFPYAHRPLTTQGAASCCTAKIIRMVIRLVRIGSLGVASYRTVEFNRMVMQRPMWMRHLLTLGYSVLRLAAPASLTLRPALTKRSWFPYRRRSPRCELAWP